MKRAAMFTVVFVLTAMMLCTALANESQIQANHYYSDASVAFNSSGKAVFSAITTFQFNKLSITSCSLQVKEGGVWKHDVTLTPPSQVAQNRFTYSAEKTYSLSCTPGKTYRFKATFNADGHTITKYSNEVKF